MVVGVAVGGAKYVATELVVVGVAVGGTKYVATESVVVCGWDSGCGCGQSTGITVSHIFLR